MTGQRKQGGGASGRHRKKHLRKMHAEPTRDARAVDEICKVSKEAK
jgi:hypothetical protein